MQTPDGKREREKVGAQSGKNVPRTQKAKRDPRGNGTPKPPKMAKTDPIKIAQATKTKYLQTDAATSTLLKVISTNATYERVRG